MVVRQVTPSDRASAIAALAKEPSLIARGNGRAYGDAALNPLATLSMLSLRHVLAFDPVAGRVTVEAGALLADLIAHILPHGWFVPVTPGTKFVTIGGAIAADVHGKNHHLAGSFAAHIEVLELALADGRVLTCSPTAHPDIFAATCGGMEPDRPHPQRHTAPAARRDRPDPPGNPALRQPRRSNGGVRGSPHLDLFGRLDRLPRPWRFPWPFGPVPRRACATRRGGTPIRRARAGPAAHLPHTDGFFPSWALNRWSVAAFNELYWRRARPASTLVNYDSYFYPLDAVLEWNRIYGRAGFVQYQCVLPKAASAAGLTALLTCISRARAGSFLSVLKLFGAQTGVLSFPMEGFPFTARAGLPAQAPPLSRCSLNSTRSSPTMAGGCIWPRTRAWGRRCSADRIGSSTRFRRCARGSILGTILVGAVTTIGDLTSCDPVIGRA